MKTWRHPELGEIGLIPEKLAPKKLWRHFYDPRERWHALCDADVVGMRLEVEALVGVARDKSTQLPTVEPERWRALKPLFLRHHQDAYGPTYLREMALADACWTPEMDGQLRHCVLTPNAVFGVVQLDHFLSWVVTAYRPLPRSGNVELGEDEIRPYAENYYLRKTSIGVEGFTNRVVLELRRCVEVPQELNGLWWLASAVGQGRLLREREEVRVVLEPAERLLAAVEPGLVKELASGLEWEELEDEFVSALKEDRPEDFEAWLADVESVLAVADALGAVAETKAFLEQTERLIPWVPLEWAHLLDMAQSRLDGFEAGASVTRLWGAVAEALVSASLRAGEPTIRPVARLVDRLIPAKPESLIGRIEAVADRVGGWLQGALDSAIRGLRVEAPVPQMGGDDEPRVVAEVLGGTLDGLPHVRVFVIDEQYPAGVEVTESARESGAPLWQFEREDESAWVVVVAGEEPAHGGDLSALVEEAEHREDVGIAARELQPTQATKERR